MGYLVLARKYRPQSFADMTGQEHVVQTLTNALNTGRVAHALLFCGPRGCGKTTTARIVAKALNCEKGPTPNPCGECAPCVEITSGTSVDVQEIDAASNTGVDNVRELRESAKYLPARDRFKIFIVDEVHMLSRAAFNAFLKTLEEPPGHVKFIFATTDPQALPDTILSRCQRHNFRLVSLKQISERIRTIATAESVEIDDGAVALVARQAAGSMRDALSVLDQLFSACPSPISESQAAVALGALDSGVVANLAGALLDRDALGVLNQVAAAYNGGHDLKRLGEDLATHLRNLLAARVEGAPLDLPEHELRALVAQAGAADPAELARLFDIVQAALFEISRASQPRHALEVALLKAIYLAPSASVQGLLSRADDLIRKLGSQGGGGSQGPQGAAGFGGGAIPGGGAPPSRSPGAAERYRQAMEAAAPAPASGPVQSASEQSIPSQSTPAQASAQQSPSLPGSSGLAQQSPPPAPAAPASTPADSSSIPAAPTQAPVAPTAAPSDPAPISATPASTPADRGSIPADPPRIPAASASTPADLSSITADPTRTPGAPASTAADLSSIPADPTRTPVESASTPADPSSVQSDPMRTFGAPASTAADPSSSSADPARIPATPASTPADSASIAALPTTTSAVPASTPADPTSIPGVPTQTPAARVSTSGDPSPVPEVPSPTSAAPASPAVQSSVPEPAVFAPPVRSAFGANVVGSASEQLPSAASAVESQGVAQKGTREMSQANAQEISLGEASRSGLSENSAPAVPENLASGGPSEASAKKSSISTGAALSRGAEQEGELSGELHHDWPLLVARLRAIRPRLASHLEHARPLEWSAGELAIAFEDQELHGEAVKEQQEEVEEIFAQVLGSRVKLSFRVLDEESAARVETLAQNFERADQEAKDARLRLGREHEAILLACSILNAKVESVVDMGGEG